MWCRRDTNLYGQTTCCRSVERWTFLSDSRPHFILIFNNEVAPTAGCFYNTISIVLLCTGFWSYGVWYIDESLTPWACLAFSLEIIGAGTNMAKVVQPQFGFGPLRLGVYQFASVWAIVVN
jgi:Ni,Fe-hydrogenase I cytochrome b subunit